jgi:DNA-binding NarL/FixJ family response regulator
MIWILIADEHDLVRSGLRHMIEAQRRGKWWLRQKAGEAGQGAVADVVEIHRWRSPAT